jgi:hypothetical protein
MFAQRRFSPSLPRHFGRAVLLTIFLALGATAARAADSYIDNGVITLGVRTDSGAVIDYFAPSKTGPNVVNSFDRGRFIQQSYYGDADGSTWAGKPWRWNPVQGGSANGTPSTLLSFSNNGRSLYASTRPRRWSTGADAPSVTMEEWIELVGKYAHVHYKMSYTGLTGQHAMNQELPAVFVDANLNTMVYYKGNAPWTGGALTRVAPPPSNAYDFIPENWAAYVNPNNWGLGVYVPEAHQMTFYRVPGKNAGPSGDGCSYVAPIATFAIPPGFSYEYDVYLTLGSAEQIRATFAGILADDGL